MMRGDLDNHMEDVAEAVTPLPQIAEVPVAPVSGPDDCSDSRAPASMTPDSRSASCLHKCQHCHMAFLTPAGLDQHLQTDHATGSSPDRTRADSRKPGRQKTIQQMLQAPVQDPPHPPLKQYECPLCQEIVGRKALWVHLKREHQATKQDAFEFVPERDMLPGSLTCRHCYSSFTMEQALVTHFKRGSCPVLTCEWARKMHFGSHAEPPPPAECPMQPSLPVLLHRYFNLSQQGLIGHAQWVSTIDLVECWFPLLHTPISCPLQHLRWYDHTIQWLVHFPELPHTRFVTDQVFQHIHALRALRPLCWAWTLDNAQSPDIRFDCLSIHDSFSDQLHLVKAALMCIAQILARNRAIHQLISHQDGTSDRGRSILHGSPRGMHGWVPQAPENCSIIRWADDAWPGAAKEELKLISEHFRWPGPRSDHDGGSLVPSTRGCSEPDESGQWPDAVPPMWQRLHHAHNARDRPSMEPTTAKRRRHEVASPDNVLDDLPGTDQPGQQTTADQAGRPFGYGAESQGHSDRRQQIALPHMECGSKSPTSESEDSFDLGRDLCHAATNPSAGAESESDLEVCRSSFAEAGQLASGHGGCHPMAAGHQYEGTRRIGTAHLAVEAGRKRPYSASTDENATSHVATLTVGQCYPPTTSQVMRGMMTTSLLNDGNSCYINSVLQAQYWTSLMTSVLSHDTWGSWTQPILSMFTTHAGEAVFPCSSSCLAEHLRTWFDAHPSSAQHDAGEFAGWIRGRMFEKDLMTDNPLSFHPWDTRLATSTEDSGSLAAPIVLRALPEADTTLQNVVHLWHRQEPFLNALRSQSPFVCLQLERYPALSVRHHHAITWEHNRLALPVFDGMSHYLVTWHEFQVIAAVLHTGMEPTSGHYRAVLFNSGSGLQCDDNRPCQRLVRDRTFYEEVYMLWLAPWSHTCQEFRIPLPNLHSLQQATLAKLISSHFD